MDSESDQYAFTEADLSEIKRRLAEPNPVFTDPAEITAIFGKPFSDHD